MAVWQALAVSWRVLRRRPPFFCERTAKGEDAVEMVSVRWRWSIDDKLQAVQSEPRLAADEA